MIAALVTQILDNPSSAEALSALVALARKKAERGEIERAFLERAPLYVSLRSPEPKARKNAARLLGALESPRDSAALAGALFAETTLFVVPSLLLALGACGGADAVRALEAYAPPAPVDETQQKHCGEIALAYQKATNALRPRAFTPPDKLDKKRVVLLVPPAGFSDVLADELIALGYRPRLAEGGALVETDDPAALYRARCFFELLYPLAQNVAAEPEAIAEAAGGELTMPYRIELRGYAGDRAAFIRQLARLLGGDNDASNYALELRIVMRADRADVFVRPCNLPDERFAYRVRALPASMHPATAAALIRHAAPHLTRGNPAVLDPFCGSGTLLFERERFSPCRALLGVDIAEAAVRAARGNAAAASSRAALVHKDILKFVAREPFDEVFANLPFGNRVGTHRENERLYRAFVPLLPRLLAPGGVAVLYTMEYRLLSACLDREPALTLADRRRTEAGGLLPWVFVLKKK